MDYIIIVAGGKGLRMGGDIPKQFLPIGGKPVLMRTIDRFREYNPQIGIVLVLPKAQQEYWKNLCKEYSQPSEGKEAFTNADDVIIADGGETRFHSVQNGLSMISDDAQGVVGVHDGVRPFVSVETIKRCYEAARQMKAVIPVTPVVETLRYIPEDKNVYRADYRLVQTPQVFDIQLLKEANKQTYKESFTDDASVVEGIGQKVEMVEGNRENIKITTPFDLTIAEALLKK